MRKLCVIIGAGASHDVVGRATASPSLIRNEWRPPLTKDLFKQISSFEQVAAQYPKANPLIHRLRKIIATNGGSLETELTKVFLSKHQTEIIQLKYLTLYLWDLFREISRSYVGGGPTNFDALVDLILRRDIEVCFLSLNYDFLLETALIGFAPNNFMSFSAYIPKERNWRLIKLHGSINWGRLVLGLPEAVNNRWKIYIEELDLQKGLEGGIRIIEYRDNAPYDYESKCLCFPALAIPIDQKYDFICTPEHVAAAREFLADCPNFLILGCSMKDESIWTLLGESVRHARNLKIVNGDLSVQGDAYKSVVTRHPFNWTWKEPVFDGGFDKFMSSDGIEKFLDTLE